MYILCNEVLFIALQSTMPTSLSLYFTLEDTTRVQEKFETDIERHSDEFHKELEEIASKREKTYNMYQWRGMNDSFSLFTLSVSTWIETWWINRYYYYNIYIKHGIKYSIIYGKEKHSRKVVFRV